MTTKWLGAAAWSAKEVHAGDRLPYARLVDEHTLLLRDGSLIATRVAGRQATSDGANAPSIRHHGVSSEGLCGSGFSRESGSGFSRESPPQELHSRLKAPTGVQSSSCRLDCGRDRRRFVARREAQRPRAIRA